MPILSTMGLKKIYVTPAGTTAGVMPAKGAAWLDLGDVYKDTCTLKDDDVEVTQHKSETSSKVITLMGEYVTTVELTLMDPDLDLMARYFGGTVSGTKPKRKWLRPRKPVYKEWAVWMQPEEGLYIGCPNVCITPKFEITYSAKGICLAPMKITFQDSLTVDEEMEDPTKAD